MAQPRVIKNYNLFVDGFGFMGLCESVTLPDFTLITEDHRAGGMDSPVRIDMGLEALELQFTLSERATEVAKMFGLTDQNAVQIQLRAAETADDGTDTPYLVKARGMLTTLGGGELTPGTKGTMENTLSCRYYRLEQRGRVIHEIDVDNMIRNVNGVDQLAQRRSILGQ